MKKLLFAAVNMNVGGIETALITLLNFLASIDYDITLVLEEKQGTLLQDLNKKIRVIEYKPNDSKNILYRKVINLIKRILFILKYKNKFDFSASYATYSKMASFVARVASTNNALWVHTNYLELNRGDIEKVKTFFNEINYNKFKTMVFVSKKACKDFKEIFINVQNDIIVCNNIINNKKIEKLSEEAIEEKKETYTFVNIGRHVELEKKLTRIIEAARMLKEDNMNFKVLFIGDGKDTVTYKELVEKYDLQDKINFLGVKKNPYPYMKLADSVVLSSDYEGYPVVFLEALVLNKPIITTDVSDAKEDIDNKYGKVVSKDSRELYKQMKSFIQNGYETTEIFNPNDFNNDITEKVKKLINN